MHFEFAVYNVSVCSSPSQPLESSSAVTMKCVSLSLVFTVASVALAGVSQDGRCGAGSYGKGASCLVGKITRHFKASI
jgi:hypothetical protein